MPHTLMMHNVKDDQALSLLPQTRIGLILIKLCSSYTNSFVDIFVSFRWQTPWLRNSFLQVPLVRVQVKDHALCVCVISLLAILECMFVCVRLLLKLCFLLRVATNRFGYIEAMQAIASQFSAVFLIEHDHYGGVMCTWNYPSMETVAEQLCVRRITSLGSDIPELVYFRVNTDWCYVLTMLADKSVTPVLDLISVGLLVKNFNPEKYQALLKVRIVRHWHGNLKMPSLFLLWTAVC